MMMEEKTDDSSNNVEDQLQLLLQEAGLESVPIDPSSLEALKAFVSKDDYHLNLTQERSSQEAPCSSSTPPPVSEVKPRPAALKRFTSELTTPSGGADDYESESSVAGSFVRLDGASPVENHILEQLHRQTRLLLQLQRRVDDLASTVEYLTVGGEQQQQQQQQPAGGGETMYNRKRPDATMMTRKRETTAAPLPPPTGPMAPARPRAAAPINNNNNNAAVRGGLFQSIQNSRSFKMLTAFWKLRRRYGVQPLDGGLIFKVLFMMAILSTRMSSSSKRFGTVDWQLKFAVLAGLVWIGFLAQTGYLKYGYIFLVQENLARRIWDGENVEDILRNPQHQEEPDDDNNNNNAPANRAGGRAPAVARAGQVPPNHPQHGQAANNNGGGGGWRNTFLGGMIPRADQGGVAGAFQDVALVLGSFLMSIFPMWQPEGPPPPREIAPPQQPQEQPPPAAGGLAAGPGAVRPPRDPAQAVDDGSDDEDLYDD